MKILTEGHLYLLENFECVGHQTVAFIQKTPYSTDSTELKVVQEGTTNEECLKMLIDRTRYLQGKFPCRENSIAITKMEEALMWFEKRTENRKIRGVEGKQLN